MTFSYLDTLPTVRDEVRQGIADTHVDEGPLPSGRNFSNGNIDKVLADGKVFDIPILGDRDKAVLFYYTVLESAWTQAALIETEDNTSMNATAVAKHYQVLIERAIGEDSPIAAVIKPFNGAVPTVKTDRYSNVQ